MQCAKKVSIIAFELMFTKKYPTKPKKKYPDTLPCHPDNKKMSFFVDPFRMHAKPHVTAPTHTKTPLGSKNTKLLCVMPVWWLLACVCVGAGIESHCGSTNHHGAADLGKMHAGRNPFAGNAKHHTSRREAPPQRGHPRANLSCSFISTKTESQPLTTSCSRSASL